MQLRAAPAPQHWFFKMLSKIIYTKRKSSSEIAKKIKRNIANRSEKKLFLVSQKQAKMKHNKMRFASFRFEAKIKKERKRDTLGEWEKWGRGRHLRAVHPTGICRVR
jgi:hypothetical protein